MIDYFFNYLGLKIAGIGALKGVHVATCGLKSVDLTSDAVKILGVHFSYDKEFRTKKPSAK